MTKEIFEGWPEGTKKIKHEDGIKEIILPKPTDMKNFSAQEIKDGVAKSLKEGYETRNAHSSNVDIKDELSWEAMEKKFFRKKTHRRQEEIKKNIRDQREFKSGQEQIGA